MGKTLVVIYGLVRTLQQTYISIFENLIKVNKPCDVIFSIDEPANNIPVDVINKFQPYIKTILDPTTHQAQDGRIEFYLMDKVIKTLGETINEYRYVLKVRCDNYLKHPIKLDYVYGRHPKFGGAYKSFHIKLEKTLNKQCSQAELLWSWVYTAGIETMIKPMLVDEPKSPWCLLHPLQWNKDIKTNIMKNYKPSGDISAIKQYLSLIHKKYKIVYLIGSTWIHFGQKNNMIDISQKIHADYGKLAWKQFGFDDSKLKNKWLDVTESQMRLSHRKHKYNLIDLVNQADYDTSFDDKGINNLEKDIVNQDTMFWLLRDNKIAKDNFKTITLDDPYGITLVTYGNQNNLIDLTDKFRRLISDSNGHFYLRVNNDFANGDPAPYFTKNLVISDHNGVLCEILENTYVEFILKS